MELNLLDYNEVSYHTMVNKYGLNVDIHDVPPEIFAALPGKHGGTGETRWCNIEFPGVKVTYFKEFQR